MKVEVKEIKPVNPPKEYVITLNQEEVNILRTMVGNMSLDFLNASEEQIKAKTFSSDLYYALAPNTKHMYSKTLYL